MLRKLRDDARLHDSRNPDRFSGALLDDERLPAREAIGVRPADVNVPQVSVRNELGCGASTVRALEGDPVSSQLEAARTRLALPVPPGNCVACGHGRNDRLVRLLRLRCAPSSTCGKPAASKP